MKQRIGLRPNPLRVPVGPARTKFSPYSTGPIHEVKASGVLSRATGTPVLHFGKAGVILDWIEGPVTEIVDGDTFDVRVEWVGKSNRRKYGNQVRVRLAGFNAPEINSPAGKIARNRLHGQIAGRYVRCDVQARDSYGRLVCDVEVVPRRRSA